MIVQAASNRVAGTVGIVLALILLVVAFGAYFLPLIVAAFRHVPNIGSVTVINTLLGWTFIGWVVALAMACRSTATPLQVNVYGQQLGQSQAPLYGQHPAQGQAPLYGQPLPPQKELPEDFP